MDSSMNLLKDSFSCGVGGLFLGVLSALDLATSFTLQSAVTI